MSKPQKNVGRVSTRQAATAHGDVGLREEAANPTYGGMAGKWKETSLAAVIDVKHGFAFPGENIRDEPLGDILLTPGNFAIGGGFKGDKFKYFDGKFPDDYVLSEGDLLVTMTDLSKQADTLGYPARVPKPHGVRFLHNQRLGKVLIKPNAELDAGFLFYLLRTAEYRHEVLASATGTTVKHTSPGRILAYKASIPPLPEQKAIAHILGTLDDKIELNRRINATLEAMARALFQSWFVDFDPVRAKLDGRHPAGLDAATVALFPAHFQDSTLGELPQGWRIGTLGELVELRTDRVDSTPAKDDKCYVALEDMPSKSIDLSNHQLGFAVNSSITAFRKGDVLFGSMRPYFHKVGLAFFDGITRTTTFVLRPRKDYFRHFALMHFFSDDVVAHATIASVGTTIPYVKWDSLENYKIPIPPDTLLDAFEKTVGLFIQRIAAQGEESRTLATLRDALLPKLICGDIRIADAERVVLTPANVAL